MAGGLALPDWPSGARAAVALTFDVDGEVAWFGVSPAYESRLSALSERRYGLIRGLPRILDLLREYNILGTFYVPGYTVDTYPDEILAIAAAGHEIAHHGYLHLRPDRILTRHQQDEVVRGIEAIERCVGERPVGYRSPAWEMTPETWRLLIDNGFRYDSSFMGDDRPYIEEVDGMPLLELPVHWSVDDFVYYSWMSDGGGLMSAPSSVLEVWLSEFESAWQERRLVTYTLHPEITGRGYRLDTLRRLIETMKERGEVWFARHRDIADLVSIEPSRDGERGGRTVERIGK